MTTDPMFVELSITESSRRAARPSDLAVIVAAVAIDLVAWNGARELRSGELVAWAVVPIAVILVHLSLAWRHLRPGAVFGLQLIFALSCWALPEVQVFAGLMVALFVMASRSALPRSLACAVLALVPFAAHTSYAAQRSWVDAAQLMILWTGLAAAVWGVGRLFFITRQRDQLVREQRAREAVQAERARMARDLHDTISHSVTTMIMQAAGSRALSGPATATASALEIIERSGVQAMNELHRMLGLLAAPSPEPGVGDLHGLVEAARRSGRRIDLIETGTKIDIGPAAETAVYRIVQESLTNALKHAGPDAPVSVALRWGAKTLTIEVSDRIEGPSLSRSTSPAWRSLSSGAGLLGLRRRTEALGGTLTAGPTAYGYRLSAQLPSVGAAGHGRVPRAA